MRLVWILIAEVFLLSDVYHLQWVLPGTRSINCFSDFCAVESWTEMCCCVYVQPLGLLQGEVLVFVLETVCPAWLLVCNC